ncbi:MAG: sugar porter family MFS transporter [Lewinella sp.]|nr:sugar porter family MFS transporter [Lewinella sp.]
MNNGKVVFWSITVALGGFLFGFDTAVISGGEQEIQQLWKLSDAMIGQMVAMALYGTIIGALFGGIPSEIMGRKKTLFWVALLYLVSAVGSALAPEIYSLMIFRFIGGLGVGASSVAAPMYISEIAPKENRGFLTALFQFNIVLGILIAYFSNFLIGTEAEGAWRWMLGVEAVPALAFVVMILYVPESPRWLIIKKGQVEEALKTLRIIDPGNEQEALRAIQSTDHHRQSGFKAFISGRYKLPIMLAFLIAFFNQVSGINAVIYYAPRIFSQTGMEESSALLSSVGIGVINLIFTMLGLALIDRMGRRFLMYIGSFGYILSLGLVSFAFFSGAASNSLLVPILLFAFIAAHAIGQGAVIWVFISEIFPNEVRSYGNSLGSATHWVFAALIAGNFPFFAGKFGAGYIFAFFALMMVLQLLFVWRVMPETKGVSLEDLEKQLIREK